MSGLSMTERESLRPDAGCALCGGRVWCPACEDRLDELASAVEQIVARHVEAFRASLVTTIEAAIDAYVTTAGLPTFIPTNTADAERTGRLVGLSAAARIVADHDSSAGHAASARPAEG